MVLLFFIAPKILFNTQSIVTHAREDGKRILYSYYSISRLTAVPRGTRATIFPVPRHITPAPNSFSRLSSHALGELDDFVHGDLLLVAHEIVILGEEEHAVALLALPHGNTRAVPEPARDLSLLVVVVPARAQRRAQRVLVLGQALDHNRRHGLVHAEVGAAALGVLLAELAHHLEVLLGG